MKVSLRAQPGSLIADPLKTYNKTMLTYNKNLNAAVLSFQQKAGVHGIKVSLRAHLVPTQGAWGSLGTGRAVLIAHAI